MIAVILTFLIVDLFDTTGTLIGVGQQANLLDAEGRLPRIDRALIADSAGTVGGALLGTSPVTSYIESAAGTAAGGRTGLTAVVVAGLFLACLFFAPLAQSIPPYATAAAILYVACLMAKPLASLDWDDVTEYAPHQSQAMTDGEEAHVEHDISDLVQKENDPNQKEKMIVTRHHVLGAQIQKGKDRRSVDRLHERRVLVVHRVGRHNGPDQSERQHRQNRSNQTKPCGAHIFILGAHTESSLYTTA